jgi:ribosomal-protein-alanine N-acetyltransferase
MSGYSIQPLTPSEARQLLGWRYESPFDYYDPPFHKDAGPLIQELVKPENGFYSVRDAQHRFIGFCSFGLDGQVLGGQYDSNAIDIGLGMKPELTNSGKGEAFFAAITAFALKEFATKNLRLTVADFNKRAIRVYAKSGFTVIDQFIATSNAVPHTIMQKPAPIS